MNEVEAAQSLARSQRAHMDSSPQAQIADIVAVHERRIAARFAEIASLTTELLKVQRERETAEFARATAEETSVELRSRAASLQRENEALRLSIAASQANESAARSQLAAVHAEGKRLEEDRTIRFREIAKLVNRCGELEHEVTSAWQLLESQAKDHHQEVKELMARLSDVSARLAIRETEGQVLWNALATHAQHAAESNEKRGEFAQLISETEFFDERWYLEQYPDVALEEMSASEHYVSFGWLEQRDPGPNFSTRDYLLNNPDVLVARMNPLVHYILFGKDEARTWAR